MESYTHSKWRLYGGEWEDIVRVGRGSQGASHTKWRQGQGGHKVGVGGQWEDYGGYGGGTREESIVI